MFSISSAYLAIVSKIPRVMSRNVASGVFSVLYMAALLAGNQRKVKLYILPIINENIRVILT